MEPEFELVKTTDSTKIAKKCKNTNDRVFHIKKRLSNGEELYSEYTTNKVNSTSVSIRCTNRKCNSTLNIECSHSIEVVRVHIETNGKTRNVFGFSESVDLSNDSLWGIVYHKHSRGIKCQRRDQNLECDNTKHSENCGLQKNTLCILKENSQQNAENYLF